MVLAPGALARASLAPSLSPPLTRYSSNMPSFLNLLYLSSMISSADMFSYIL